MSGWFTRPAGLICGFLVASLLVLGGLSWATFTALEAEAGQQAATVRADRASREQLALWRLDGFVLSTVGRENARPFDDYTVSPSPLVWESMPAWVNLHLQLDPATGWASPQSTDGGLWNERLADLTQRLPAVEAARQFATAQAVGPPAVLAAPTLPTPVARHRAEASSAGRDAFRSGGISGGGGGIGGGIGGGMGGGFAPLPAPPPVPAGPPAQRGGRPMGRAVEPPGAPQQIGPGDNDLALRQQNYQSSLTNTTPPPQPLGRLLAEAETMKKAEGATKAFGADMPSDKSKDRADRAPPPPGVHLGPMRAVWVPTAGEQLLFLVRPAQSGTRQLYQAVWIDWPQLRDALAYQIEDLLPHADFRPAARPSSPERALTALPVELDPGPLPPPGGGWTPLRTGLTFAWTTTLLALGAVAAGGRAVVALADRRVRFVSAVTHELRTPLTSLRLYLDLLAGGLVTDDTKRQEYLVTLSGEADRLHRLIENVLDFARLERRSVRANCVPTPVADILVEVQKTWSDRLAADGKELVVNSTLPPDHCLVTDPRMAGQILANLVDNARKYSRDAFDPRVWVWARPGPRRRLVFEVEDRGPGVPDGDRAGLFRAFRRGRDVDAVAGGAGLGLALAAQWAGLLGGSLTFRPADGGVGACFRLELPAGSPIAPSPPVG